MGAEAWVTLGVLAIVLAMLTLTRKSPDVVLLGGLGLLLLVPVPGADGWALGVINAKQAFEGAGNEGVITIAVLYVVAAALRETGAMGMITQSLLGRPKSIFIAQLRLMLPTAGMSAFLNNTPLVAMLLPVVGDWANRNRFAISKLLIPLSFASILGGACTLIGTSTNLIVNGWMIEHAKVGSLGMFEMAWGGLPCAVAGIAFLLLTSDWLLPDRKPALSTEDDARQYTVEMIVETNSPLVGKTIEQAGLRHLPGLYLIEIERESQVMPAVGPAVKLRAEDRLVFTGVIESVVDLQKIRGLAPATNQIYKLNEPRTNRVLVEAVVSDSCPLVGRTIREGRFRTVYNAAVIAVARNGQRVRKKVGDIILRAGDTLLLEARASFAQQQRNSRDFYLVSALTDSTPPRHEKAFVALAILAGMVVGVTSGLLTMLQSAMIAAALMLLTRCVSAPIARRQVDWQVLLVIAASIGIGNAMDASGLAAVIAHQMLGLAGTNPTVAMSMVLALTMLLAGVITSKAAAVLMLPIALATASDLGVSFLPFAIAIIIAAATTIATPIGYPTNLMVYGPGGYRFSDYVRVGGPITAIIWLIATLLIPVFYPFTIAS